MEFSQVTESRFNSTAPSSVFLLILSNAFVWAASDLQFFHSFCKSDCAECTHNHWYNCHVYVPQFFHIPGRVQIFIKFSHFLHFYFVICINKESTFWRNLLFFAMTKSRVALDRAIRFNCKVPENLIFFLYTWLWFAYNLLTWTFSGGNKDTFFW